MLTAFVVVAAMTAAANLYVSILDFRHDEGAVANATKVGLPLWSVIPLGILKTAGALGLLVGIWLPAIGITAAVGLVLFFGGAVAAHIRVRWFAPIAFPGTFLLFAVNRCRRPRGVLRVRSG